MCKGSPRNYEIYKICKSSARPNQTKNNAKISLTLKPRELKGMSPTINANCD